MRSRWWGQAPLGEVVGMWVECYALSRVTNVLGPRASMSGSAAVEGKCPPACSM